MIKIRGKTVTDTDRNALTGIAVTEVDDSNGTWQLSLSGTSGRQLEQ